MFLKSNLESLHAPSPTKWRESGCVLLWNRMKLAVIWIFFCTTRLGIGKKAKFRTYLCNFKNVTICKSAPYWSQIKLISVLRDCKNIFTLIRRSRGNKCSKASYICLPIFNPFSLVFVYHFFAPHRFWNM